MNSCSIEKEMQLDSKKFRIGNIIPSPVEYPINLSKWFKQQFDLQFLTESIKRIPLLSENVQWDFKSGQLNE
jgi:hypothetical protein